MIKNDKGDGWAEVEEPVEPAQWWLAGLIAAFAAGTVIYKLLMHEHLGHSAAMFVGLPAVLAILLSLAPRAKTAKGGILKGLTISLLVLAPLLGEGFLCILVASPLFYVVGIIVGVVVDRSRRKRAASLSCVVLLLLPMSLEGTMPQWSFERAQEVATTRVVEGDAAGVQAALAAGLRVGTTLPAVLRIGFPVPLEATGTGLSVGDTRTIHFSAAEGEPAGDLKMRVAERRPGYVRFARVSDACKVARWTTWQSSEVEWKEVDVRHTEVTWRIRFERQLDPAWYFNAWERAAVKAAAAYLIEADATPVPAR